MKILMVGLLLFLAGCVATPVMDYQKVYIPVNCTIQIPTQPAYNDSEDLNATLYNAIELKNYANSLYITLLACEGKNE